MNTKHWQTVVQELLDHDSEMSITAAALIHALQQHLAQLRAELAARPPMRAVKLRQLLEECYGLLSGYAHNHMAAITQYEAGDLADRIGRMVRSCQYRECPPSELDNLEGNVLPRQMLYGVRIEVPIPECFAALATELEKNHPWQVWREKDSLTMITTADGSQLGPLLVKASAHNGKVWLRDEPLDLQKVVEELEQPAVEG